MSHLQASQVLLPDQGGKLLTHGAVPEPRVLERFPWILTSLQGGRPEGGREAAGFPDGSVLVSADTGGHGRVRAFTILTFFVKIEP
jgi:hypothetical protein